MSCYPSATDAPGRRLWVYCVLAGRNPEIPIKRRAHSLTCAIACALGLCFLVDGIGRAFDSPTPDAIARSSRFPDLFGFFTPMPGAGLKFEFDRFQA